MWPSLFGKSEKKLDTGTENSTIQYRLLLPMAKQHRFKEDFTIIQNTVRSNKHFLMEERDIQRSRQRAGNTPNTVWGCQENSCLHRYQQFPQAVQLLWQLLPQVILFLIATCWLFTFMKSMKRRLEHSSFPRYFTKNVSRTQWSKIGNWNKGGATKIPSPSEISVRGPLLDFTVIAFEYMHWN